mmetsp:Transcript_23346/g.64773  ORF Transcript_23346/g.64773 Transcript_23346/m.64773 type:complete len:144 (+) Transcript_23346:184-615(+)
MSSCISTICRAGAVPARRPAATQPPTRPATLLSGARLPVVAPRTLQLAAPVGGSMQARRQVTRMGLFGLGVPEIAVIAGVAAVLFGPSKLPELGKGLGKTVKSFQTAAKEFETELKSGLDEDAAKKVEAAKDAAAKLPEDKSS